MDVPTGRQNFDFSYTYFCPHLPPIDIPISYKKQSILLKLGAFHNNLLKMHPILCKLGPLSAMKTPNCYTEFCEKSISKGRYVYHVNVRNPTGAFAAM